LLAFWNQLDAKQQAKLAAQIEEVDFDLLQRLFQGDVSGPSWEELARRAEPPTAIRLQGEKVHSAQAARQRGEELLAAGQVGVVIVAGGQGTRLGFDHPKGMFSIGAVSGAPLFQILLEKILARGRRYGVRIPLYLMTSPATDAETREYLRSKSYFGLLAEDVKIFCQGTMPAVDAETGKLLRAAPDSLFLSPDGHGGMLAALERSGGLADARRRGLTQLFYCQIDNPLVSIADPEFLGFHLLSQSELSTQVIAKQTSRDKVGNVAMIDGRLQIIEYSDLNPLSDDLIERRGTDGEWIFWAGSIGVHVFDVAFLERAAGHSAGLPFHRASKAVPYVDARGERVEPDSPNAIKFERFIFDLLPLAERGIVVEIDEVTNFAPVKNAPGESRDTPEIVQQAMIALHRRWLEHAGARVLSDVPVEISPLFAQNKFETAQRVTPATTVTEPRYFC